jgi:molybdopterin-guanine dinucleotide biosynthesis protein A
MPWLDPGCVRRVLDNVDGEDCVIPFINGRAHPMHAAWSKGCMKQIEAMIDDGNLRINDLLKRISVKRLTEEYFTGLPIEMSVENVNTREDLERTGLDGKKGQL